jgi:hypothetical protein
MANKYYNYENIKLWDLETWKDKISPVCALASWIETVNNNRGRALPKPSRYAHRTDGIYTHKSQSLLYPEIVKYWDDRGLVYKCDEMGMVNYIAMLPRKVINAEICDPRVLLVFLDADYNNHNWAMDTLEDYREYLELACRENLFLLFVVTDGPNNSHMFINILQELAVIHRLVLNKVYIDVSPVYREKQHLSQIPGFVYTDLNGIVLPDPDASVKSIGGIPVLNITQRWQNKVSALLGNVTADTYQHPQFDLARHVHSPCGKKMADGMALEYQFDSADDPAFLQFWDQKGLRFQSHQKNGERWVVLAPRCVFDPEAQKLPVMLIFQEVNTIDDFRPVSALSCYYEYCDLAASGELILLFFSLETPDANELLVDILQDAAELYPIDLSRIYVTGHSHNGHLCMEFVRRHHNLIAAAAPLGNAYGLPAPSYSHEMWKVTDEMVDLMSTFDLPVIDICGITESDFAHNALGTEEFSNAVHSWQRRLKAVNAPMKSFEEISAVKDSPDLATRVIGVPNDRSEIQFRFGCECYIADILNSSGKLRLRLVALENLPHTPAPQMPGLTWDFVRRFARNLETGEIIERY